MDDPPIHPAATLIVMRDRPDGPPDLLMVERARTMAFAGGALVFPGGRVDGGDQALAATMIGDPDDMAARVAAIRETLEEAGIAIGLSPLPDGRTIAALASEVYAGRPIGDALDARGLTIDPDALVAFSRWLPRGVAHRIFDTRFYLARMPGNAPPPRVDGTENVRLFWASAADVLADADAGRATIIFPTRRNLERLARFESFAEAAADAASYPVETVTPWIEERDGTRFLCIPDHLGYPVTAEALDRVRRS